TIVVNDGYLVIANAIDVIFLQALRGIVDQELANTGIPVGKDPAANPLMIGAVKTTVVVAVGLPVEEPQALIVEARADVIENKVEKHRHSVEMENVNNAFKLVRPRPQVIDFQHRNTLPGQESIGLLQIAGELGTIGDMVIQLWREKVKTIVTLACLAGIFLNRQQLYRVDAEIA